MISLVLSVAVSVYLGFSKKQSQRFEILKERQQSPAIGLESIGITNIGQIVILGLLILIGIIEAVYFTNRFLTKFVFSKIEQPLETLVNGVHQMLYLKC